MKSVDVTIQGISPLLMHSFPLMPIEGEDKLTAQEQAEAHVYRDPKGFCVPAVNLQRALVAGSAYSKGKGRGSLQKIAAACLFVSPVTLSLGKATYVVDSRPVVIPATRGRIVRHRARFDEWSLSCTIEYDDVLLSEVQVRRIVDDTGSRVGLLDFRPEKRGPFGRFTVIRWE